jgi:CDP-diacylglycerol---serine O-phosphatidyltransferase
LRNILVQLIKTIKNSIPNLFTLANLCCGVLGIILVFEGKISDAAYLIWIAAIFDFLDGFLAKVLKAQSELGRQLDSLADLVTFGVLPSIIYYSLLKGQFDVPLEYLAFIVAIFSALRLAKFNIDESQSTVFSGLTTTANGILASSIPIIMAGSTLLNQTLTNKYWLVGIMVVPALLLVTPIRLLSLKFSDFNLRRNIDKFALIGISILFIGLFRESAIPLIIGAYIILSIVFLTGKKFED